MTLWPAPQPPPADLDQVRSLPQLEGLNFRGIAELAPNGAPQNPAWNGRPTSLHDRYVASPRGPEHHRALVLRLYPTREAALQAAATRERALQGRMGRMPIGWRRVRRARVRRYIVEVEGVDVRVLDARELEQLSDIAVTEHALNAWRVLEAARLEGHVCVLVRSDSAASDESTDTLVIFPGALGTTIIERDSAIYVGDRKGFKREPLRQHPLRRWVIELSIAFAAAVLAHPTTEAAGRLTGESVEIPAPLPVVLIVLAAIAAMRRFWR